MKIGEKIAEARKKRGLTQVQLANRLGVSSEAVSKWESGTFQPSKEHLERIYEVLHIPYLAEENRVRGSLYNERHMSAFLKGKINAGDFPETARALAFAKDVYKDKMLNNRSDVPFINHPLTMTCHALAMGLEKDHLLAALLLHDVIGKCGLSLVDLPVSSEVKEIVSLVTRTHKSERQYYKDIAEVPDAALVKCIDRCNFLSTMAMTSSALQIQDLIDETVKYYPELLRTVKNCPEYNNAAWLLSYQIRSLLQAAKRMLQP